jgi:hypothetical protein
MTTPAALSTASRKHLEALRAAFGEQDFMFDFRFQYAHGVAGGSTASVGMSARSFQKLVDAGALKVRDLAIYTIA